MDIYKLKFTILELEIFMFLSLKAGEKLSQRDIAKALNVSPTAVGNSIVKLAKENLVNVEKAKTINFISFNRDNKRALELKKIENLRNIYISGLFDYLELELAGACALLFGSYAKGEDTKSSDIDIAAVGRKPKTLNLEAYEKMLNRKINVNYYTSWEDIDKHLKNNILNGIVLCGGINL
jgi:predicted nucleotidyltransferase